MTDQARYTEHHVEQGTDAWFEARLGRLTGSKASEMLSTKQSSGEAAGRKNLRAKLMLERITGRASENSYKSKAMERGTQMEPEALAAYEAMTGQMVTRVGFLAMNSVLSGASPDGLVDGGIVEAKCPQDATHLGYLKSGKVPGNYLAQCWHLLWVTGLDFVDWFSYAPDWPDGPNDLRIKLVRVPYVDAEIDAYGEKALEFLGEVDAEEQIVREMAWGKVEA